MKHFWQKLNGLTALYLIIVILIAYKFIFPVLFDYGESMGFIDLSQVIIAIGIILFIITTIVYLGIVWLVWAYHRGRKIFKKVIVVELTLLLLIIVCLYGFKLWRFLI